MRRCHAIIIGSGRGLLPPCHDTTAGGAYSREATIAGRIASVEWFHRRCWLAFRRQEQQQVGLVPIKDGREMMITRLPGDRTRRAWKESKIFQNGQANGSE